MKLSILMTGAAFLPEAYAYQSYLQVRGWEVVLERSGSPSTDSDAVITFQPEKLRKRPSSRCAIVHEYHSLATGKHPRLKQLVRNILSVQPDGRIFLNEFVRSEVGYDDDIPYIYREMGVDEQIYQAPEKVVEFDVVYCGSVHGREGVVVAVRKLQQLGFSVLVVGNVSPAERSLIEADSRSAVVLGASRNEVARHLHRARFGLNVTPDRYPLNVQTSTKTLEYLAAGLTVISNRYRWAEEWAYEQGAHFIWLDEVRRGMDQTKQTIDMRAHAWGHVLSAARLEEFLIGCVRRRLGV